MKNQEKLRVSGVLDDIIAGKHSNDRLLVLTNSSFGVLKYFKEKLWFSLVVLEVGGQFDPLLVKKTFELIKERKIPPHYPQHVKKVSDGHTLKEAAIKGAAKTLMLALSIQPAEGDVLAHIAQMVTSNRVVSDPRLISVFDVLLNFDANFAFRNHAVIKNIDANLGGQSLAFAPQISESEVLSLVEKNNYPFFEMMARYKISYVTPLTLKYHLLVTKKTPIDYLLECSDDERPVALLLMGA